MGPFEGLVILFGLGFALLGPIGFIVALICLGKLGTLSRELENLRAELRRLRFRQDAPTPSPQPQPQSTPQPVQSIPVEPVPQPIAPVTIEPAPQNETPPVPAEQATIDILVQKYAKPQPQPAAEPLTPVTSQPAEPQPVIRKGLEQQIGTQWILVAGIVCVIAAVGFILKHAIDEAWLGPWARVSAVAAGGIVAFVIGEITRRRGYEVVAKGVSAMGFALLYAAVFWAYRGYHLVDSTPAFAAAIVITIAAMAYAVLLDEVLVAILSLLGGYATPLFLSTGQNLPHHLFGYVLILSLGAMGCAFFRRWRAVNLLAFIGTFLLYILWFEKFTRPILSFTQAHPTRLLIAGLWLGVFFVVYLVTPLLYGWVKQAVTRGEDLLQPCAAGTIFFYYLWTMLEERFRPELALCTALLGAAYWIAAVVSRLRCKQDQNLWTAMGIAGTAFLTAALPLYFEMYALVIGWTVESVILIAAGILYAGVWMQGMGFLAMGLSLVGLVFLPSQDASFTPVFNGIFGTWLCAAAGILASHIVYRRNASRKPEYSTLSEILFIIAAAVLLGTGVLEWHRYWSHQEIEDFLIDTRTLQAFLLAAAVFIAAVVSRPVCPAGLICRAAAVLVAVIGAITAIANLDTLYYTSFRFVLNGSFAVQASVVAAIFIAAIQFRSQNRIEGLAPRWYQNFGLAGVVTLWAILSEQVFVYWYCLDQYGPGLLNWKFKAHMSLSLLWAAYAAVLLIVGFNRRIAPLRYMALGLFGILLAKIFLFDMSEVKSIYRITAFLATGLTLVGVSYIYQYLRKQGFFDRLGESASSSSIEQLR
jgi:uncharacterized membrane protein